MLTDCEDKTISQTYGLMNYWNPELCVIHNVVIDKNGAVMAGWGGIDFVRATVAWELDNVE